MVALDKKLKFKKKKKKDFEKKNDRSTNKSFFY